MPKELERSDINVQEVKNRKIINIIKKPWFIITFIIVVILIISIISISILLKPKPKIIPPTPQPISLRLWSYTENAEHYKGLIDEYHAQNPLVTITFEQRDPSDYYSVIDKRLRENITSVGDIFELNSADINFYQQALSPAPAKILSPDDFQSLYFSQIQTDNILNGNVLGVPTGIDGLMLVFNTDIVKEEQIPIYWSDFIKFEESKKIVNADDSSKNSQNGLAISSSIKTKYLPEIARLLIIQNGQNQLYDSSSNINLNQQYAVEALNLYKRITNSNTWDENDNDSISAFAKGNTAFAIVKASDLYELKTLNPKLNFKTRQMPLISEQLYLSSYTSFVVNNSSSNPSEAWKFLKFISSETSAKELYTTAESFKLPKKPYALKTLVNDLKNDPLLKPIGVMEPNFVNWLVPDRKALDDTLSKAITDHSLFDSTDITTLNHDIASAIRSFP